MPIFTAIAAFAASSAIAGFVVNFALSMIVNRIFAADPPAEPTDQGSRQQIPPNTTNAIPIVYGNAFLGGTFVDAVITTDQKIMFYTLAISSISPNGTFTFDTTKFYYGDRLITFGTPTGSPDPTNPNVQSLTDQAIPPNVDYLICNNQSGGISNLIIYLYTSDEAGTITPVNSASMPWDIMGSASGLATDFRWASTGRRMNGLAFAIVRLQYSRDAQTTQLEPITFNVTQNLFGKDRATPAEVWYDYIRNVNYGGAVPDAYVDTASGIALNTYSDQYITYTPSGGGSATQRRYTINGVISAGDTVLTNINKILIACDSWMAYDAPSGKWSLIINKEETAAYAFNDNNIISDIHVSVTDINSSINQIEAKFPNKDNKDQGAYVNLDLQDLNPSLLYPNEPVNKSSISFDLVNNSVQAYYLANRMLEQAREDLIVSFDTTYYGIQCNAGDVISVTNVNYGWTAKLFRVMKVNEVALPDGTLGANLNLNEYNADVYDNVTIVGFAPAANSGIASAVYFSATQAPTVTGYPSATSPTFSVTVYLPITGRITNATLFYTTVASPAITDWKQLDFAQTANSQPVVNSTSSVPAYYGFLNLKLSAGTYYFGYLVGNELGQSAISAVSSAFVWTPASAGLNSAIVYLYNKNTTTTPPTLFSGTFTYTFATAVLSGGTLNGWSQTPPSLSAGEYLFMSLATASSTTATDTIVYTEFTTPTVISGVGTDGAKTSFVSLFNKNTSASSPPASPSGTFTYTFSTGVLSGGTFNSWSQSTTTLATGEYLWQKQAVAYGTGTTVSIAASSFSGAVVVGGAGTNGSNGTDGTNGLSAVVAYRVQSQSASTPTFATTTSGSSAPSGWSLTVSSPAVGEVLWYINGQYNSSTNQTAWTGPVATSIFQDIKSDNWNGGTSGGGGPPTWGTPATYGTTGYYIVRNTGDSYFGNGVYRGNAIFQGSTVGSTNAIINGVTFAIEYASYSTNPTTSASSGKIRTGVLGQAVSTSLNYGAGVMGINQGTSLSVGVYGEADIGGYFRGNNASTSIGMYAIGYTTSNIAMAIGQGYFSWGGLNIPAPPNNTSTFLRGDGTWSAASGGGGGTVTSVSGTGAVSGLTLTGTVTTSGNLTLGGSLSLTLANVSAAYSAGGLSDGLIFYQSGGTYSTQGTVVYGNANSGYATGSGYTMNFLGSTSTGIVGAYVGTTGSGNTITFDVRTSSPSDVRLKEEIKDSNLGLDFVNKLRPVSYKLKADSKHQVGYGFIADEVEKIIDTGSSLVYYEPDWQVGEEKGFKTIHYPSYVAVLTKAIQELTAKVESLEAKLEKLNGN